METTHKLSRGFGIGIIIYFTYKIKSQIKYQINFLKRWLCS